MSVADKTKPMIMGGLMGLMMIWMLHGALTGDSGRGAFALAGFVGLHLVVIAVAVTLAVVGARLSPRLRGALGRVHRPSFGHVVTMLASAAAIAGIIHLGAHGLGAI